MRSGLWKARHVARYGDFQHTDTAPPVRRTFPQRFRDCGYPFSQAGEILGGGAFTAEMMLSTELGGAHERGLIFNPGARAIGVGVVLSRDNTPYWITEFGTRSDGANDPPPIAHPISVSTSAGRAVMIDVLANVSDRQPQWLGIDNATNPQNGMIGIPLPTPNDIRYTPYAGFTGTDQFQYVVANLVGLTATGTVTVHVGP